MGNRQGVRRGLPPLRDHACVQAVVINVDDFGARALSEELRATGARVVGYGEAVTLTSGSPTSTSRARTPRPRYMLKDEAIG